jgi:hypothetical protein
MKLALLFILATMGLEAPARADAEPDAVLPGMQFKRFNTADKLGRDITYYVATPAKAPSPLPLAVFVQGSGCDSQFRQGDGAIVGRMQDLLAQAVRGRMRVMVVEKPGVHFLDESQQMGSAEGCSAEFLREHTLPRWAEAVGAAVRVLRAELVARGKRVTAERIDGVGHLFCKNAERSPDGMRALMGRVADWLLKSP